MGFLFEKGCFICNIEMEENKKPWLGTNVGLIIEKDDYHKNCYPPPPISKMGGIGAIITYVAHGMTNMSRMRQISAASHKGLLYSAVAYWTFDKLESIYLRYVMGKYKFSLDYLLNCEDSAHAFAAPIKFSDPSVLRPWNPVRAGGNTVSPVEKIDL